MISILKPGKDQALPFSYQPINLLNTIGKLFEKILLARNLHVVSLCYEYIKVEQSVPNKWLVNKNSVFTLLLLRCN